MKRLFFILILSGFVDLKAQLFPIRTLCSDTCVKFQRLTCSDTLFVEDLIGEGNPNPPKVIDCFVFKFSEWNMIISYKLENCEKTYLIKDGYIGPIYIYEKDKVTVLQDN